MSEGSVVFCGHRPLGYVSNHVPLVTRYITRRKEHLIVTVSGRTFQTWGSNKLGLLSVSKIHPKDITSLAADSYLVFAAAGEDVYAWRRGDELQRVFRGHNADVHLMLPFGPHLITIDTEGLLKVWEIKTGNEHLEMTFNNEKTRISAICHPSTYIDKILVGSSQGHLQLWNLKSTKLIYTFKGWGSGVSCLQQAPAIDVVAIGLLNGEIHLHNLKYDETVIKFHQDWGAVTGLGFRTDDKPVMVSGSPKGHLAVWDLEERKLEAQMRSSHQASVTGLACLSGEPILVTSSSDNSVKQWIFDMSDGGGRLLRIREGHAAPPGRVRYYGNRGESLLSAGLDSSLRVFSTVADILHKSLGHASWNRKVSKKHRVSEDPVRMPPIVDFTTETAKDREWDNIAAIHRGQGETTTWSFGHSKMGDLKLLHPRFKEDASLNNAEATALTLTACGNFVLIGYSTGHVDRFNIQSGLHRGSYEHGKKPAHKNVVRGIATCAVNMQTITVDSKGVLKFWKFKTGALLHKLLLGSDVGGLRLQRESGLLALALEDFTVQVVDIDTRTVVRKFPGHDSTITDFCFSSDSRWLVTVSLDSTARVWELPTGHCIDYIAFDKPATSVDLSPASDMMATSHVGDLGVYLWINKSLYSHLTLKPLSEESKPIPLSLPSHILVEERETSEIKMEEGEEEESEFASPAQLSNELITLANLPGSRWLNLLNLDVIKAKNKPKAPPKKPKAAPFFLPTIPGLATQFDLSAVEKAAEENTLKTPVAISFTKFGAALSQAESEADMGGMLESLLELGPSAIDLELRSLAPEGGGSLGLMESFLKMIRLELKAGRNFEAVQSYLGLFLKLHGETVAEEENMYDERTKEWRDIVGNVEKRREELGLSIPPKDKSRILAGSVSHIRAMARIVETVAGLDKLLKEQRSAYLASHGGMLERERDEVDVGADSISRQCRLLISKYREEILGLKLGGEGEQHFSLVADGLDSYLKSVVSVHSEMRAVRVARQIRQKKLSRLEVNSAESRAQEIGGGQGAQGGISVAELQDAAKAAAAARVKQPYSGYSSEEEEELSLEEQQAMEMENERLVEQLSSLTNQVEQVQSKVVKVAELQAVFTEKVLEQADILDAVHAQAVNATENTKEGNEAVRQAIQNKASYRVYILFILLVFSFSLLFLDWYND